MEIATLFLIKAGDIYLKENGWIAFVLPRSLFSADQHDSIRQKTFQLPESQGQTLQWTELWDCENVQPLFMVPSCVVYGYKTTATEMSKTAIPGEMIRRKLSRKNASLDEAEAQLTIQKEQFNLFSQGQLSCTPKTGQVIKVKKT